MKTNKKRQLRKLILLAAVVTILLALGVTAYATDLFGLANVGYSDPVGGGTILSMQGYTGSVESRALMELQTSFDFIETVAAKYGLRANADCAVLTFEELCANLGGAPYNERHTQSGAYMYADGTFGSDGEYEAASGVVVNYQLTRSVRGSLTNMMLYIGDESDYEEWNYTVGKYILALALKDTKGLIIADLGSSFVTVNVLNGTESGFWGEGIDRALLEELAASFNWDILAEVREPDITIEGPTGEFGPGVALEPGRIIESQSFSVELETWGEIRFISYAPGGEFEDVRFFLSYDGAVSDYELHTVLTGQTFEDVAAVSFLDLTGDGHTDILVILDYTTQTGAPSREARIFKAYPGGEFDVAWEETNAVNMAVMPEFLDVAAVRDFLDFGSGGSTDGQETVKIGFSELLDVEKRYDDGSYGPYYSDYAVFDFNGDGTPELLAFIADRPSAGYACDVYAMEDGESKYLGELSLAQSMLYVDENGELLRVFAHMSYEEIYRVAWNGSEFEEELLSSREVPQGEDYAAPGTSLLFAANGDRSLLEVTP